MSYIEELEKRVEELEEMVPQNFSDCIDMVKDRLDWLKIILDNEYPDTQFEVEGLWSGFTTGVRVKHMMGDRESSCFMIPWKRFGDSVYVLERLEWFYKDHVLPTRHTVDMNTIIEKLSEKH